MRFCVATRNYFKLYFCVGISSVVCDVAVSQGLVDDDRILLTNALSGAGRLLFGTTGWTCTVISHLSDGVEYRKKILAWSVVCLIERE
jgi:hypothetical protein